MSDDPEDREDAELLADLREARDDYERDPSISNLSTLLASARYAEAAGAIDDDEWLNAIATVQEHLDRMASTSSTK